MRIDTFSEINDLIRAKQRRGEELTEIETRMAHTIREYILWKEKQRVAARRRRAERMKADRN